MIEGEVSIPPLVPDPNKQFEGICTCVRNLGTAFRAGRFISRQQVPEGADLDVTNSPIRA
jgi:hypothetical protein